MSAMEKLNVIMPSIAQAEPRGCSTCNWSWNLPPTNKEVKEGIVDSLVYCCHSAVQVAMNGELFPRLALISRERVDLCGSKGKLWQPIKVLLSTSYADSTNSFGRPQSQIPTRRGRPDLPRRGQSQDQPQQHQSHPATQSQKARKPYTV